MNISVRDRNDCTIVSFHGGLTMDEIKEAEEQLRPIVEGARQAIVIKLNEVEYIDSSGTGLLVTLLQWARENKRLLILAELHPSVAKVFQLSNLTRIFEIVESENEALQVVHPRKIFLFDNREDIVFFYQEVVQANRFAFLNENELEPTLELLRKGEADLVIMDVMEKDEPKYDLIRRMKTEEKLAKIPIVVLSIYEDEEFQYSQFGVDRFILKPFLVEKFVATLKQLLSRNQAD